MFHQYFHSSAWALPAYGLGLAITSLWVVNASLNLRLSDWTQRFFDTLHQQISATPSAASLKALEPLLVEWGVLTLINVCTKPAINFLTRHWAFQWREALTADYLFRWRMAAKAAKEEGAAATASAVEGASQRVQDDCYKLAQGVDSLGQGALAALLQLLTFVPLLWRLSSGLHGLPDGTLVYLAVGGNLFGYCGSLVVGQKLVGLEYDNQKAEAAFRKELVYAEDEREGFGGLGVLHGLFRVVRRNYQRLFAHFCYFELWSAIFCQAMTLAPMLVMLPYAVDRSITFGTYMQSQSAFLSVQEGLTAPIQRWIEINELLSVSRRLHEFERALVPQDADQPDERTRLIGAGDPDRDPRD